MDRSKILPMTLIVTSCLLSSLLTGCSTGGGSQSNTKGSATIDQSSGSATGSDDFSRLKAQLEQQQQQLETMSAEQQSLQEQLKRQQLTLTIRPTVNANAGHAAQGTASTAYIAFLEEESQFTDIEALAAKEVSVIPNREASVTLAVPQQAQFIAVKVGLRYTKKRSQFLVPLASLIADTPLVLNIGACDVNIAEGISPEQVTTFTTKLKYYQQPLVSCS
ncbi:hypothetical protein AAJP47_01005 [Psychrobacter sp. B38]|uniref:hypothetical protein n=1 Tax=Psychrobacter sp. B38 TaxID=3143538 RepID=UPI00320CCD62